MRKAGGSRLLFSKEVIFGVANPSELLAYVQLVDAHEPLAEEEGQELLVDDGLEFGDEELPG